MISSQQRSLRVSALLLVLLSCVASGPTVRSDERDSHALSQRLASLAAGFDGQLGLSVVHVETGRTDAIRAKELLPLYSVFKLPLAIVTLQHIEQGKLRLDQRVSVAPQDVSPGIQANTERWRRAPMELTVQRLLELSMVESDNTSSDKLLGLAGGPLALTARVRALGFANIRIAASTKQMMKDRQHPNRGSAEDLSRLLAQLQLGRLLAPAQLALLEEWMRSSQVGARRLRAALPPGVIVMDKTGTGMNGSATNDVGIVTLPGGRGHLAIAVLLSDSKWPQAEQEKLIADVGRAAFEAHSGEPTPPHALTPRAERR